MSMVNIFFVGLPMAYLMAITLDFGIDGLWYGEIVGFGFNLIGYGYIVFSSADWSAISLKCQIEMEERNCALDEDPPLPTKKCQQYNRSD